MTMVRVELPASLCRLASLPHEVSVSVAGAPGDATQRSVIDALEAKYPALAGTLRDPASGLRRPFVRFFACGQDISHFGTDEPLPPEVQCGREPLLVIGAIAGG